MAKKRSQKRIKDKKLGTFKFIYAPRKGREGLTENMGTIGIHCNQLLGNSFFKCDELAYRTSKE